MRFTQLLKKNWSCILTLLAQPFTQWMNAAILIDSKPMRGTITSDSTAEDGSITSDWAGNGWHNVTRVQKPRQIAGGLLS